MKEKKQTRQKKEKEKKKVKVQYVYKIRYECLDPQIKNYQFKLYVKHKVYGKWTQAINRIDKQFKPI